MANKNSIVGQHPAQHPGSAAVRAAIGLLACALCRLASGGDSVDANAFAPRAERAYRAAGNRYAEAPADPAAAWQFARACYDWAEYAADNARRAAVAQEGIAASRALIRQDPELAPAHYYLAMNLGQLARTRSLGALPLLSEMEKHFKRALDLDPAFDQAGADRCLGLLYRDAPGWPLSLGSKAKARTHLERAVERCPDSVENRLHWIESLIDWNDKTEIALAFRSVAALLPQARAQLSGDEWAPSWADWDRRWQAVKNTLKRRGLLPRVTTE